MAKQRLLSIVCVFALLGLTSSVKAQYKERDRLLLNKTKEVKDKEIYTPRGKIFEFAEKKFVNGNENKNAAQLKSTFNFNRQGKQILKTSSGCDIWVNVTYAPDMTKATDRSISKFNTNAPTNLQALINGNFTFYNGIGLVENTLYAGHNVQVDNDYMPLLYSIDTETWKVIGSDYLTDLSLMAFETATAKDGTIYGVFFNSDGTSKEFGIVDYKNKTRSTIFTTNKYYCALGVTKENELYGIAIDGYLYRIDLDNKKEIKIGHTGVNLMDSNGTYFFQTGEIDQTDNTFYWLGTDQAKQSTSLYTVDLTTGKTTELYTLGQYTFSGMIIRQPEADNNAPAAPENVSLMFQNEETTGNVVFTAPLKTFGGDELRGELSYKIFLDGTETSSGTTTPGENKMINVSTNEGMHVFEIVLSNSYGNSPTVKTRKWIGYDIPEPASNIVMELDKSSGYSFIYWEAPTKTLNDGFFGGIYYDIYRIGNGKKTLVVENYPDTYFEDYIPMEDVSTYCYGIVARNGSQRSEMAFSNSDKFGNAFTVPYFEDFEHVDKFNTWTNVDVNGDKVNSSFGVRAAWVYDKDNHAATYTFGETAADDWLISPPIKLIAGKNYVFSMKAKARAGVSYVYPEQFEVKLGNANTIEAMQTELIPEVFLDVAKYKTFENNAVSVTSDGEYFIGIHGKSSRAGWTLYVDSVMIELTPSINAPDSVTQLKAIAEPSGALSAEILFTAPTKTVGKQNIVGNISKIDLRRDNKLIHTYNNVSPGEKLTFTDNSVTLGYHSYVLYPFINDEQGVKNEVRTYVGVDIPARVRNIKAYDEADSVKLTWNKVGNVGANNGLVIPENVDYIVWNTASYNGTMSLFQKVDSVRNASETKIKFNTDEGEQGNYSWAVQAQNAAGAGEAYMVSLLVGKPYDLPFKETLPKGQLTKYWKFNGTDSNMSMKLTAESSDGDGYAFDIETANDGEYSELYSGKIALKGAVNPTLTFDLKGKGEGNTVGVYVVLPDGTEIMESVVSVTEEYNTYKVNLSKYIQHRYVRLAFFESFDVAGNMTFDNINVVDINSDDLMINQFNIPQNIQVGDTANVKMVVKNYGINTANNYQVKITCDEEELLSENVTTPLTSMQEQVFETKLNTTIFDTPREVNLKAEIVFAEDINKENNIAEKVITLLPLQAAPARDLSLKEKPDGVEMSWKEPEEATKQIVEDFEDTDIFVPFSLGGITSTEHNGAFGDWTLIDGDGKVTSMWGAVTYENAAKPHAWQVINPRTVFGENMYDGDKAHSGNQYLISFCPITGNADDWLISPELPGMKQNISFFAKCLSMMYGEETFDVLYSTTDKNKESFIKIGDTQKTTMSWEEKVFALPEGTKYFAIRHNALDAFGLLIDDIKYNVKGGSVEKYNIYLDKKHIATVENGSTTYLVSEGLTEGDHLFSVTAQYADNVISAPISETLTVTSIDLLLENKETFDVYTLDGKLVMKQTRDIKHLEGVYIINGKKVIIKAS